MSYQVNTLKLMKLILILIALATEDVLTQLASDVCRTRFDDNFSPDAQLLMGSRV